MKALFLFIFSLFCSTLLFSKNIKWGPEKIFPDSSLIYCINPYDCPNCYLGFQIARKKIEPDFKKVFWVFPKLDSSDLNDFIKLHFNQTSYSLNIISNDTIYKQFNFDGLSSVLFFSNGHVIWRNHLRDLRDEDVEIPNLTPTVKKTKEFDVSWCIKSNMDKFYFFNDSNAVIEKYLKNEIWLVNPSGKLVLKKFTMADSSLLVKLLMISPNDKEGKQYNLSFIRDSGSLIDKYGMPPLRLGRVTVVDSTIWVGISMLFVKEKYDSTYKTTGLFISQDQFIVLLDKNLEIKNMIALPVIYPQTNIFSMVVDINPIAGSVYLSNSSRKEDSLISHVKLNVSSNSMEIMHIYPKGFPSYLPRKSEENGLPIFYSINVVDGLNKIPVVYYSTGLKLYDVNDMNQTNLSPSLDSLSKKDNLTFISSAKVVTPVSIFTVIAGDRDGKLFFISLDKNYKVVSFDSDALATNSSFSYLTNDNEIGILSEKDNSYYFSLNKIIYH